MSEIKTTEIVAIFSVEYGKVLFVNDGDETEAAWGPPSGHVETKDVSLEAAAIREV